MLFVRLPLASKSMYSSKIHAYVMTITLDYLNIILTVGTKKC